VTPPGYPIAGAAPRTRDVHGGPQRCVRGVVRVVLASGGPSPLPASCRSEHPATNCRGSAPKSPAGAAPSPFAVDLRGSRSVHSLAALAGSLRPPRRTLLPPVSLAPRLRS